MTTAINPLKLSCFDSNNLILSPIPNDVTLRILRSLESLVDFNSFTTCTHSTLKSRSTIWFDWARRYGYEGKEEGSQKYLTGFFSRLAEVVENNLIVSITTKFRKGAPGQRMLSGYLISQSLSSLTIPFTQLWVYKSPELIFLIQQIASNRLSQLLNSEHVIKEILIPAARSGDLEKIRVYCMLIKNPNLAVNEYTPMHAAASAGHGAAIKILHEYGADVNCIWRRTERRTRSRTRGGVTTYTSYNVYFYKTPLDLAYNANRFFAVKALLQAGVAPEARFYESCRNAHLNMLRVFLEISSSSLDLHKGLSACFMNHIHDSISLPCIELLLKYGASPNIVNKKGKTQLYRVVREANLAFVQIYCTYGADPEIRTNKGKSPLYAAIKSSKSTKKRMEIIRILCARGADMHAYDRKGHKTILEHSKKEKKIHSLLLEIQNEQLKTKS